MSENHYHNNTNRINWYVRENLTTRICLLMLDAHKFSCVKISTFTVSHPGVCAFHADDAYKVKAEIYCPPTSGESAGPNGTLIGCIAVGLNVNSGPGVQGR